MPKRKTPTSSNSTKAKQASSKRTAGQSAAKKKPASTKKKAPTKRKKQTTSSAVDDEVTINRREADRRTNEASEAGPTLERRQKVNRRRQIDPTTCERDYSDQEVEFMNALDDYKRKSGRMFPTCSEVLEVIRSLGYVQLSTAERAARPECDEPEMWSPESEEVDADAELVS